jgi:hypothetical protein
MTQELLYTTTERVYVDDTPVRGRGRRLLYPVGALIPESEARRLGLIKRTDEASKRPGDASKQSDDASKQSSTDSTEVRTAKVPRPKT